MISVDFVIQHCGGNYTSVPNDKDITHWSQYTFEQAPIIRDKFSTCSDPLQVTIRVVDEEEMKSLNRDYRNRTGSTNVLSFPFDLPEEIPIELLGEPILGDIVLCAPVIEREAVEQNKSFEAHWAHMLIHGNLHLMGYDHIQLTDAEVMENHEIRILKSIGFENPYHPLKPPSRNATLNQ